MRPNPALPGVLLAHQGGWDEIALVVAPVAIIIVIMTIAKRRVDRIGREHAARTSRSEPHAP